MYPNIPFEAWPLENGPVARAVELSPRSRTGSGAGSSLRKPCLAMVLGVSSAPQKIR